MNEKLLSGGDLKRIIIFESPDKKVLALCNRDIFCLQPSRKAKSRSWTIQRGMAYYRCAIQWNLTSLN
jgi:hypothetical protein